MANEQIEEVNMAVAFKGDGLEPFDLELTYPESGEPFDFTNKRVEVDVFNSRNQPVYKFSSTQNGNGKLTISSGLISFPRTRWKLEPGTYKGPVRIIDDTDFAKAYLILVFPFTGLQ